MVSQPPAGLFHSLLQPMSNRLPRVRLENKSDGLSKTAVLAAVKSK